MELQHALGIDLVLGQCRSEDIGQPACVPRFACFVVTTADNHHASVRIQCNILAVLVEDLHRLECKDDRRVRLEHDLALLLTLNLNFRGDGDIVTDIRYTEIRVNEVSPLGLKRHRWRRQHSVDDVEAVPIEPNWPDHVTGDEMVAAMDKVGVDGAIFLSVFSMYRYDASYAVEVQRAHPERFAIVKPVDPNDPAVADVIADWKKTPGTVGIRIMLTKEAQREPNDPGLDRILRAAAAPLWDQQDCKRGKAHPIFKAIAHQTCLIGS
jgi:hypothetical protein